MVGVTITIEKQAHRILKNTKAIIKGEGKSATLSSAICNLAKQTLNLCDTCKHDFAYCEGNPEFGTGRGRDNVYDCVEYVHKGDSK